MCGKPGDLGFLRSETNCHESDINLGRGGQASRAGETTRGSLGLLVAGFIVYSLN